MKVSIGIPVYGVEKYIERCARSLFDQTYKNIEYVFVDDCSEDNSISKLRKIVKEYPNRRNQVKILSHRSNRGLAAARNTALEAMTGEYLLWVDSDDYIANNLVEIGVKAIQKNDLDIVSFDYSAIYKDKNIAVISPDILNKADYIKSLFVGKTSNPVWGRLIRKSIYINNRIRVKEGINMSEDLQVVPLLFYYASKVSTIHQPLYFYNCTNTASYTATFSEIKGRQSLGATQILLDFFKDKPEYLPFVLYRRVLTISGQCYSCGYTYTNRDYFHFLLGEYHRIDTKYHKILPITKRIGLKINNFLLFHLYALVMTKIKNIINYDIKIFLTMQ